MTALPRAQDASGGVLPPRGAARPESAAIFCRDLRKTYPGGVEAVRGLDLEVARGECFGLLGPNGAGKTTTVEILEGLLPPTTGEVRLLGLEWRGHERELRERIGLSLQETRLSEKLTVRETVALFAAFYRRPRPVDEVLAEMSLTEKAESWVGKLSGGQKQRLAVATALVADPELLFLDEPTTGLDPQSRRQLWDVVRGFKSRGGTVMLTTHYMEEAERLCDRVAVVDRGRIIALGSPAELIERFVGPHVIEFIIAGEPRPGDAELWRNLPGALAREAGAGAAEPDAAGPEPGAAQPEPGMDRQDRGEEAAGDWGGAPDAEGRVLLAAREPHAAVAELLARLKERGRELGHLGTRRSSLEDVFVRLTGRGLREE